MIKKNWLLILLFCGLFLRVVLSFIYYSGDIPTHMLWGKVGAQYGLSGFYEINFMKLYQYTPPNYPPLTLSLFSLLFLLKPFIYQLLWFLNIHISFFPSKLIFFLKDFDYYPYLLKIPAILSDIGIAYVIYLFAKKIVGKKKSVWPFIATSLILFNPAFFYNSAYWGQIDSIPLFFLLVSFYLLLYPKKYVLSGIFFTLGLLAKQTIVIFLPLFSIIFLHSLSHSEQSEESSDRRKRKYALLDFSVVSLLRNDKIRIFIRTIIVSLFLFWISFIPFYKSGNIFTFPFTTYLTKILLVSGLPFTSNHAFNLWFLLTGSRSVLASSHFLFTITYEVWGYLITVITVIVILYFLMSSLRKQGSRLLDSRLRGNDNIQRIFYAAYLIAFISFLFLTKIHERHLILTLPFLLLISYRNKFLFTLFIFASLFNFFNMYHNWWSPKIPLLQFFLSYNQVPFFLTILLIIFFLLSLKNYLLPIKI